MCGAPGRTNNSHPHPYSLAVGRFQIPISRQRPQREEFRITVIAQVEHPRKASGCIPLLVPNALFALAASDKQHLSPPPGVYLARCHQPKQGPCRLRGRAGGRFDGPCSRACSSTPSSPQPPSGFWIEISQSTARRTIGIRSVDPCGVQRAQHRPGSVDVVHAPAAVPGAVGHLGAAQIIDAAPNSGLVAARLAELRQHRDAARGHILGRRIEQRAVIGERDVVEIVLEVVGVEGAPSRRRGSACPRSIRVPRSIARRNPCCRSSRCIRSIAITTTAVSSRSG